MNADQICCENCYHWSGEAKHYTSTEGVCFLNPPTPVFNPLFNKIVFVRPEVSNFETCGYFKAKD